MHTALQLKICTRIASYLVHPPSRVTLTIRGEEEGIWYDASSKVAAQLAETRLGPGDKLESLYYYVSEPGALPSAVCRLPQGCVCTPCS